MLMRRALRMGFDQVLKNILILFIVILYGYSTVTTDYCTVSYEFIIDTSSATLNYW